MKNLIFVLLTGLFVFTSCTPEVSIDTLTPSVDFSGTYSGILTSDDGDNMAEELTLEITSVSNNSYSVIFINEESTQVINTLAVQDESRLIFDRNNLQTLSEGEPIELQYILEFIDSQTLEFEMSHKYEGESEEYASFATLKRK